jgi:choline dehydrogenase
MVADLPGVGANLHDHVFAGVIYTVAQSVPPRRNNHGEIVAACRAQHPGPCHSGHAAVSHRCAISPAVGARAGKRYTIALAALNPHSRGSVRLASADPATAPLIDPNFLGDDCDLVTMLTALDMAREIGPVPPPGRHLPDRRRPSGNRRPPAARTRHRRTARREASVMPAIPGANPNATVLAIAERAATLLGQ